VTPPAQEAARAQEWAISTTSGETVRGYLPAWAQHDPSRSGVDPHRLHIALADITHEADAVGMVLPVAHGQEPAEQAAVLAVTIVCKPFGDDDEPRAPVASVQIVEDNWIRDLTPDALEQFGQRLQALGDLLATTVAPALSVARADWARYHPTSEPVG
jgi:hypothetical protein